LWVRTEPFLVGALPAPPPARLTPHYLRKAAAYARARADQGCFPRLSWPSWRHIACGKLLLKPEIAWLYFELFRGLGGPAPPLRLRWAEAEAACTSAEELEWERSKARARPKAGGARARPKGEPGPRLTLLCLSRALQLSVDTLQFLLFLYVQQFHNVSLRRSLLGDEWPSPRTKSPSLSGKSGTENKNWDDQEHLAFVQSHLLDILELLLEPEQLSASSHSSCSSLVSLEAVCALSFLLEGTISNSGTVRPLHKLALRQPCHGHNGYSKGSRTFSLPKLESWLRSSLTANPLGITVCVKAGKKLAWAQQ
ncbi:TBCC1 protein, partial [Nesospiza acunhae]|nr:TBCC1 protein [Nesospiza acunhae]